MYPQRIAVGVLFVAIVLLYSSKTTAVKVSGDGSDHNAGIHSGGQQARPEPHPFAQKGTSNVSQLRASMNSMIDQLQQTHEDITKQHSEGYELLVQVKNRLAHEEKLASERAQIIDELKQKVSVEATRGALLRIKSQYAEFKHELAGRLVEFDSYNRKYAPYGMDWPYQVNIIQLMKEEVDDFQKVMSAELGTILNNIDDLRTKGKQELQQYGPAKEALTKLKSEFEEFEQYLADQFSRVNGGTRFDFPRLINMRAIKFHRVLKGRVATALDNINCSLEELASCKAEHKTEEDVQLDQI